MQRKWRERYPERFRGRAVERMSSSRNISQLARDLHVCRILLYKWRDRLHPVDDQEPSEVARRESRANWGPHLKSFPLAVPVSSVSFLQPGVNR